MCPSTQGRVSSTSSPAAAAVVAAAAPCVAATPLLVGRWPRVARVSGARPAHGSPLRITTHAIDSLFRRYQYMNNQPSTMEIEISWTSRDN